MPLVLHETLENDTVFAVWKIKESDQFYFHKLIISAAEEKFLEGIRHPEQKTRWLASRYLLKYLLQTDEFVELLADENGKPYLNNFNRHISLSHSDKYAAVIISEKYIVGIDIEDTARDIGILKHKFLSSAELASLKEESLHTQLLIYWGAKEVMYKIYGKRKLEFREHMHVYPFEPGRRMKLQGSLRKNDFSASYKMHAIVESDYVLVTGAEDNPNYQYK